MKLKWVPMLILLSPVNATVPATAQTDYPPEFEPPLVDSATPTARAQIGYHSYTGTSMSDSYDPAVVGTVGGVVWGERFGGGVEFSYTSGSGTPNLRSSSWDVSDSWVNMTAYMLGFNILYRLAKPADNALFEPYALLGPALWLGSERISATASRIPLGLQESFRAELFAFAISYGLNTAVGTTMRVTETFRALFEVRWILSASGDMTDLTDEGEEASFDSSLYEAVDRPGYNFTGWRIDVGVQW